MPHGGPRRVGATKTHLRAGDESDERLSRGEERCEGTYTRGIGEWVTIGQARLAARVARLRRVVALMGPGTEKHRFQPAMRLLQLAGFRDV